CDGSVIAQMGMPDMKVPIQYALTYPERKFLGVQHFDLSKIGSLTFKKPDMEKFPTLKLGYLAAKEGGTIGATLNAANEVAVQAFLESRIKFTEITSYVEKVINNHRFIKNPCLEDVLMADNWARQEIKKCLS
ncbi:MAG TPA: 1-deoxy-D-xylulose-5-phosphate reductoisomerase, partial [Candidatus Wujingus californicus]